MIQVDRRIAGENQSEGLCIIVLSSLAVLLFSIIRLKILCLGSKMEKAACKSKQPRFFGQILPLRIGIDDQYGSNDENVFKENNFKDIYQKF